MTTTMRSPIARTIQFAITSAALIFFAVAPAAAQQLITNGGFESGLTGWTVSDEPAGNGSFLLSAPGATTPTSGFATAANASGGTAYAVSDQTGPGAHQIAQNFFVPGPGTVTLTFQMFVNDSTLSGGIVGAQGLDFNGGANQHARVDLLPFTATPLTTTGVIRNFYLGVDPGANPHAYTNYSFDITPQVGVGGLYQLRFAEVDNQGFFNMGIDNVSIIFAGSVPTMPVWTMLFLTAAMLFLGMRLISTRGRMHTA